MVLKGNSHFQVDIYLRNAEQISVAPFSYYLSMHDKLARKDK